MDEHTRSHHGVGESESRSGEDVSKGGQEPGRESTGHKGETDRPTGKSTARDVTGVNPMDPINRPADQRSG